jgi:translation initiation factor 1
LRVLQRTGRKRITIVEGLSEKLDLKRILKSWKKDFHVNGSVITDDPKYEGPIIKISGDCRQVIYDFLVNEGLAEANQIKMHGA